MTRTQWEGVRLPPWGPHFHSENLGEWPGAERQSVTPILEKKTHRWYPTTVQQEGVQFFLKISATKTGCGKEEEEKEDDETVGGGGIPPEAKECRPGLVRGHTNKYGRPGRLLPFPSEQGGEGMKAQMAGRWRAMHPGKAKQPR